LACTLAACTTIPSPHSSGIGEQNLSETGLRLPPETIAGIDATARDEAPPRDQPSATPVTYEIVRYIGVDARSWKMAQVPQDYSDLYTRLQLSSLSDESGLGNGSSSRALRNYRAENRSALARLLSGRTDTVTTIADVTIREPGLTVALPLFSISHASGSKLGNTWNTHFTASSVASPLFRIGPNTALTIHLSAKVASDVKSQGASLAVGAISLAVKIAAPTSPLLTTLSKPETNNAATAIDAAISSLLSHDISEDIEVGRLSDSWSAGSRLVLYGCAPFVRAGHQVPRPAADPNCAAEADFHNDQDLLVGKWALALACPRLSAFDVRDICGTLAGGADQLEVAARDRPIDLSDPAKRARAFRIIAGSVSDAQILNFSLASQVTVANFVQSQDWFTAFAGAKTRQAQDYRNFCYGGMVGMEAVGLSRFDSALVLRAIIHQLPQVAGSEWSKPSGNNRECLDLLKTAGAT
jgi:hypothetical protein